MKIGAMNNPGVDLYKEIKFIIDSRFDFLDLTVEPGFSYSEKIDIERIKKLKKQFKIDLIGHTPWDLPFSCPYENVRKAAFAEYIKCLDVFSKLGIKLANIHPYIPRNMSSADTVIEQNIEILNRIIKHAKKQDITIMMENTKDFFCDIEVIGKMLHDCPGLKLHWDVGHANLGNQAEKKTKLAFENFKDKIVHLHFSDNTGQDDQHLPLGAGNIDWMFILKILKEYKYDKTITLEIHSPDASLLLFSRDKLRFMLEKNSKEDKR
jgi:sugar phosphate isomerase/epimerase